MAINVSANFLRGLHKIHKRKLRINRSVSKVHVHFTKLCPPSRYTDAPICLYIVEMDAQRARDLLDRPSFFLSHNCSTNKFLRVTTHCKYVTVRIPIHGMKFRENRATMKSKKVSPLIAFKVVQGFSILVTHRPVINAKLVLRLIVALHQ